MKKWQVIEAGCRLQKAVPWGLTWSCYEGRQLQCGKCPTCLARKEAFLKAQAIVDITPYEDDCSFEVTP